MEDQQFIYQLPRMQEVRIARDVPYVVRGDVHRTLDVYRPASIEPADLHPAVIFVHGAGSLEGLAGFKDHAQYQMWGRLAAASGLAAVVFNHRSSQGYDSVADVADAMEFVRNRSDEYNIDRDRLAIWSCSAGGYLGLRAALKGTPDDVRCAVCYYGVIDLELFLQRAGMESPPDVEDLNPIRHVGNGLGRRISLQIVRAGRDHPDFNASIDSFVQAALEHNMDLELINYAAGQHAFDCFDDSPASQAIVQRTLDFMTQHLV
jgi:dienelactone hydrolase